jgi:hypothetical protein
MVVAHYSKDDCAQVAKRFHTRGSFAKDEPRYYEHARTKNWLNDITRHMALPGNHGRQGRSKEECAIEAKKYSSRSEFFLKARGHYKRATQLGCLDEICAHMALLRHEPFSKEDCVKAAGLCSSRSEFVAKYHTIYAYAHRNGLLDEVCAHMKPKGGGHGLNTRGIYAWEFSDRSVYVGLSWDSSIEGKRYSDHLEGKGTGIVRSKIDSGCTYLYIDFGIYYHEDIAGNMEAKKIEEYHSDGWIILNQNKPGALGGGKLKWTNEELKSLADKYDRFSDFRRENQRAYWVILERGKQDLLHHMKRDRHDSYTHEELVSMISRFSSVEDFKNAYPDALKALYRYGKSDLLSSLEKHGKGGKPLITDILAQDMLCVYEQNHSYAEVARIFGRHYQTVVSAIKRAKKKQRDKDQ